MAQKRAELLYWTGSVWANAKYRWWNTSLTPDNWESNSGDQGTNINPITSVHITDTIGNPRRALVTLSNRPRQFASSNANERVGRFATAFSEYQNVRIIDPFSGSILLAGKIYDIDEKFDFGMGSSLVLDVRDASQELADVKTAHWPDVAQTGNSTVRSTVINTLITGSTDYVNSSLIATNGEDKVDTSKRKIEHTSLREFKGNKTALQEISAIAAEEPHSTETNEGEVIALLNEPLDDSETGVDIDNFQLGYANADAAFDAGDYIRVGSEHMLIESISSDTLTVKRGVRGTTKAAHDENAQVFRNPGAAKFGFDYHVDYAVTDARTSVAAPAAHWNYYQRGTRPDTPKTYGLTIKYPTTSAFTPDGQNKIMQNDFSFDKPKGENYTDVILEYTEKGAEVRGDGVVQKGTAGGASTPKRRLFERFDITSTSGRLGIDGFIPVASVNGTDLQTTTDPETFEINNYASHDIPNATVAADVLNVNDYIQVDEEIMKVTARDAADHSVTVARAQFGTSAVSHANNSVVYRNPKADPDAWGSRPFGQTEILNSSGGGAWGRIEYQSHISGSGLEVADPPGFIIASPFHSGTANEMVFNSHTPTGSGTQTGSTTSKNVVTKTNCRYASVIGMRRTKVIKNTTTSDPSDLRKQIASFLSRNTVTGVTRGEFKVSGFPYTYITVSNSDIDSISNATITVQSDAFTDNDGNTTSDARLFGAKVGDVICELDSTQTSITRYAYISALTANTIQYGGNTPAYTSDGTLLNIGKPLRIYIPLRAGHVIRAVNDIVDVDEDMLVTEMSYDDTNGVAMTSLSTLGQNDSAIAFKPNVLKSVNDNAISYGEAPTERVPNFPKEATSWTVNAEFTSSSNTTVNWAKHVTGDTPSGDFQLTSEDGAYVYDIGAGNTGTMTVDTEYIVYFDPTVSVSAFLTSAASEFVKKKTRLQIATVRAENSGLEASYQLFPEIGTTGGDNPKIKASPEKILSPAGRVLSGDGSASLPTFSFTSDPNTGMYQYTDDEIGFTVNGSASQVLSVNGILTNTQSTTGTDAVITGAGLIARDSSSIQYKENVKSLDFDSSKLSSLRPVSYNYKFDNTPDIGLIAEEVSEVYPELINYNTDGSPESVKYTRLAVVLLQEIQKLQQEVEKLKGEK